MKITVSSLVLGLAGLALLALPEPATGQGINIPGAGTTVVATTPPTTAPVAGGAGSTTTTPTTPTANDEEEEDEVVVDILVAGATEEQAAAIASLLKWLQMSNKVTVSGSKVNATAEWDHKHSHTEAEKDRRAVRRALRTGSGSKAGFLAKAEDDETTDPAVNRTRCSLVFNGGNYSVVHVTLHGKASKALVNNIMNLLTNPHIPPQVFDNRGIPLINYVCKTNVRMSSEAPPADFAPMSESDQGLSAGQKAGVAVGVIGGAAAIGAVGFFAFKGFGAAAATATV